MRLLKLTEMRDVSLVEIQGAALCWAREQRANPRVQSYGNSASFFVYAAKKWLRFHGRLNLPSAPLMRFADQLNYFARHMTEEQGLSPYSVRSHRAKTSKFLEWFGERHRLLTRARIEDVDEFLSHHPIPCSGDPSKLVLSADKGIIRQRVWAANPNVLAD